LNKTLNMADWDDEEFEPEDPSKTTAAAAKTDKWSGEDSDDECKDNWEDDSDEEKKEGQEKEGDVEGRAVQKKKKKKLADIIAEKEAKKLAELEELARQREEEIANMTPEAKLAEKLRCQRLEEERELELAKDMMGVKDEPEPSGINFKPSSKDDFQQLSTDLLDKFRGFEDDELYQDFASALITGMCTKLSVATLKKVKGEAEAFVSAKLKEEKASKAKKGKGGKGATIKMDSDRTMMGRGLDDFNDMDDFM